jgi:hypothetical protein
MRCFSGGVERRKKCDLKTEKVLSLFLKGYG